MRNKESQSPVEMSRDEVCIQYFMAQMAQNEELAIQLEVVMQAINNAERNGLEVTLFRNEDGEITYTVQKRKRIGFDTL